MKHFKKLTLIMLVLSLLLSGCGGTYTDEKNEEKESSSTNEEIEKDDSSSNVEKEEYTLSEYLSTGETIWFYADGYGKDDKIKRIYVIEPEGTVYFYDCNWKVGEAEQKEDEEIIAYVKQEYEKKMLEDINKAINWQGSVFDDYSLITSDTAAIFTPYLEQIEPAQYKLSLISDSTGNVTEKEVFVYQESIPLHLDYGCIVVAETRYIELARLYGLGAEDPNCFQVYDSWYGGYLIKADTLYPESLNKEIKTLGVFITRVHSNKLFKFDEVGTENIGIDNAGSLFEEKIIKLENEEYIWQ